MIADIKPRPTVKPVRLHTADVIGRQIVSKLIALIGAHPKLIRAGAKSDADGVANSPGVNVLVCAVRVELKNARTVRFAGIVGIIRARTDRDVHFFSVRRENNVARPMPAARQEAERSSAKRSQRARRSFYLPTALAGAIGTEATRSSRLRSLMTKVLLSPNRDHGPRGTSLKSTNCQSVTSVSFKPR